MDLFKILQILTLSIMLPTADCSYEDFIVEIFTKYKRVSSVVGVGVCWKITDTIALVKSLSAAKIRSSFPPQNTDPFKSPQVPDSGGIGILMQSDCDYSKVHLKQASDLMLFNRTYKWLILAENETDPETVFKNLGVRIDAEITFATKIGDAINIYDIYGYLARQGQPLVVNHTGNYTKAGGLQIKPQGIKYRVRNNFQGYPIIAATVITRNFSEIQGNVTNLLASRTHTKGVVALTKYHNDLLVISRDMFNFSIIYDVNEAWAGNAPNGTPVGALSYILTREVDILATGLYITTDRPDLMDFVPSYWIFDTALMYRVSGLDGGQEGSLVKPFQDDVWMACMAVAVAIFLFLRFSGYGCNIFNNWGLSSLSTLAAFCQQGMEPCPTHISQRMMTLILYVCTLLLYNYYTSSIVGYLLSVQPEGLETIEQVAKSPLTIVFEDVGYGRVLVQQRFIEGMELLYQEKIKPGKRSKKDPEVFANLEDGVRLIKEQRVAYHSEPQATYEIIAETFNELEICEIRKVSVYQKSTLYTVFPKRSPLTKMFSVGYLKAKEHGLMYRFKKWRFFEEPECTANFVAPVNWHGVSAAFKLLGIGMGLSVIILMLEKLIKEHRCDLRGRLKENDKFTRMQREFRS